MYRLKIPFFINQEIVFLFFFFFAFEIIKGFSTNTIDLVSLKLSVVPLLKIISVKYKL